MPQHAYDIHHSPIHQLHENEIYLQKGGAPPHFHRGAIMTSGFISMIISLINGYTEVEALRTRSICLIKLRLTLNCVVT